MLKALEARPAAEGTLKIENNICPLHNEKHYFQVELYEDGRYLVLCGAATNKNTPKEIQTAALGCSRCAGNWYFADNADDPDNPVVVCEGCQLPEKECICYETSDVNKKQRGGES